MPRSKHKPREWSRTLWQRTSLQTPLVRQALEELGVSPRAFQTAYEALRQEIWDRRAAGVKEMWKQRRQQKEKEARA